MIISRTPFRISFAGGGTDLSSFYKREPGATISTAINKYVIVTINKRFDDIIRAGYSRIEKVKYVNEIKHPLIREALKVLKINSSIEITSIADIPSGTGMGSSGSFAVGLLNVLNAYKGKYLSKEQLAREACRLEIDILGEPVGKQDQYIASFGGFRYMQFNPDGSVVVESIACPDKTKKELNSRLMLFYTGITRKSSDILEEQHRITHHKLDSLRRMKDIAKDMKTILTRNKSLDAFGELLHEGWFLKKNLVGKITNDRIDYFYKKSRKAGAIGGKILGAGGGGFLLLYCRISQQNKVRQALGGLREVPFNFETAGSSIIYKGWS
ncbi:MAG: GHMP kinase [Candidatus Omnitrophota bacterium]|nr:GHMP kinase [Candidatus Omnitrophota bacterium]